MGPVIVSNLMVLAVIIFWAIFFRRALSSDNYTE